MSTQTKTVAVTSESALADVPPGFRKVLVVDDDPAMRRIVSRTHASSVYQVVQAVNGLQAMEAVQSELPFFVITDWEMPILDGAEFCRMIRLADLPHYVYIVMLTGSHSDRLVEGLTSGADDFLTKPFRAPELLARLQVGVRVLELENRLRLLAASDPLTGLINRRNFFEIAQTELSRSRRYNLALSCVMIDVDHFKRINDTHGHLTGDAALVAVSQRLRQCCRASDYACRYGGEEFCVLLPETNEQGAASWASNCRLAIAKTPIVAEGITVQLTLSLGVAELRSGIDRTEELLDLADQALLAAKRQGRNRVTAFSSL
jgi:two-component system cell cycle response regulator